MPVSLNPVVETRTDVIAVGVGFFCIAVIGVWDIATGSNVLQESMVPIGVVVGLVMLGVWHVLERGSTGKK